MRPLRLLTAVVAGALLVTGASMGGASEAAPLDIAHAAPAMAAERAATLDAAKHAASHGVNAPVAPQGSAAHITAERLQQPIDPDAVSELVIHRLTQPDPSGHSGTGLPQDVSGTPVVGAVFTATPVPGFDLADRDDWNAAAELTVSEARQLSEGVPAAASGTTTAPAGVVSLRGLPVALYLVQETSTPSGVIPVPAFLMTLPHHDGDTWLTTVHVYPKSASVAIDLTVDDAGAVTYADPVTWISRSTLPADTDHYLVRNLIDPRLQLVGGIDDIDVSFDCVQCSHPFSTDDIEVRIAQVDGRTAIDVELRQRGRALAAASPAPAVDALVVRYRTTVAGVGDARNGSFSSAAQVFPTSQLIATGQAAGSDTAVTKFGPLQLRAVERADRSEPVAGVRFQLFASEADARQQTDPVVLDGADTWTTGNDGVVHLDGLRFSEFVNGLHREPADSLHRTYYIAVVGTPAGQDAVTTILPIRVGVDVEVVLAVGEEVDGGSADDGDSADGQTGTGDDGLPRTGMQLFSVLLLFGAVLVVIALPLLRRRTGVADTSEST